MKIPALILCLAAFAGGLALGADGYQVAARIQPDQGITETHQIRLILQATGAGQPKLTPPQLSKLTNLTVVGGPSQNFNSVWSNGRFSSTSQLIYMLQPNGPGPAEIPPLELLIDGKPHRTKPIRFTVGKVSGGVPPSAGNRRASPTTRGEADVFVRAELASRDVWVGESVPLTVSLYVAERERTPSNPQWTSEPALSSFWVETLDVDPNTESYAQTLEGRRYSVYPISRKVIVPQTAGDFEIEPFVLSMQVRAGRSRDRFDIFSFGSTRTIARKSQALNLAVKSLPAAGRPAGFGGAVGAFSMKVSLDRTETAVNDAVALKVTVEGQGLLQAVEPPALDLPGDVKVFDPEIHASSRTSRGRLVSRKSWEWVLVPLAPGQIQLPDLRFHYFDPGSGTYKQATEALEPLVVRRSDEPVDVPQARGDIQLQRRDLAFIKSLDGRLSRGRPRAHARTLFVVLLGLPLAWVPLAVLVGRRRAHLQQNRGLARSRKAGARARKRLRSAKKKLETGASAEFHQEVAGALVDYVADRFDRSSAGLTYELADELLASRGLEPELRRAFRGCLETCDFARYVPAAGQGERRGEILAEAVSLIGRLEKAC